LLSFVTACGEWVVARYAGMADLLPALHCLEAAWAQTVDVRYARVWEPPDDWTDPVRGPIARALDIVALAVEETSSLTPSVWSAAQISRLVTFVAADPEPFARWRNEVIVNLRRQFPFHADDPLGDVVPIELFDTQHPFDPLLAEAYTNALLAKLDVRGNPFLLLPGELEQAGFEGKAYVYSVEKDRNLRRNW
jgi:hypothetical protein